MSSRDEWHRSDSCWRHFTGFGGEPLVQPRNQTAIQVRVLLVADAVENPDQATCPATTFVVRADDVSVWRQAQLTEYGFQCLCRRQLARRRRARQLQAFEVQMNRTRNVVLDEGFAFALFDNQQMVSWQ